MEDQPDFESKDIFLKKDKDILGLHAFGDYTDQGFQQFEAWCNAYDENFKFLGSIYRIFGPIEKEAEELKKEGWTECQKPSP